MPGRASPPRLCLAGNEGAIEDLCALHEVVEVHLLAGVMGAVVVADEEHGGGDAGVGEDGRVVAGARMRRAPAAAPAAVRAGDSAGIRRRGGGCPIASVVFCSSVSTQGVAMDALIAAIG